jgi:putative colanic acid biosysnthesis UDP-glucose lipid carrier transferase
MAISLGGKLRLAKNDIDLGYYKDCFRLTEHFKKVTKFVTANGNFDDWATRLGKIIWKTNIYDFSEILYIFLVGMPIFGARTLMLKPSKHYTENYKKYLISPSVKPDLSGCAGLFGFLKKVKDVCSLEKRVEYDSCFIKNWSLYFAMPSIFLTLLTTKGNKNAF